MVAEPMMAEYLDFYRCDMRLGEEICIRSTYYVVVAPAFTNRKGFTRTIFRRAREARRGEVEYMTRPATEYLELIPDYLVSDLVPTPTIGQTCYFRFDDNGTFCSWSLNLGRRHPHEYTCVHRDSKLSGIPIVAMRRVHASI